MGFSKYTRTEGYKVASPKEVEEIEGQLELFGAKSVNDLPDDSKRKIAHALDSK